MKFRIGIVAAMLTVGLVSFAQAQPGGGRGGFGGPGGGGIGGLFQDDKVKAELNLVPDQEKKIEALGESLREKGREALRDINWREMTDADRAKFDEFRASAQKEYEAILLPQQRERLKQLMLQRSQQFTRSPAGINDDLAKELNVTDAQKEALAKKAEEVRAEVQKKIAKIQEESRAEILSVLTAEQRSKLEKLLGAKFEFSQPQFGGPGGRGGPGGNRGGNAPLQRPADGD